MKLLKLLAQKMDKKEQKCLPLLLNCFYYRETLFIVYELLRDNLYHMYARADRTRTLIFGPSPCCAREHALERAPHTRPAVPATSTSTSAGCQSTSRYAPQLHEPSEPCPPPLPPHPLRRLGEITAAPSSTGGARARGRSAMPQHARLSAQERRHPLRSGASRSDLSLALVFLLTCLVDRPLTIASCSSLVQKPENILIESLTTCKIKVIDYGNAYLHHDQRCSYVQSRAYRAPEVVLGLSYSTKVDMWSLGCILMELFTGKLLFDNKSVQSLLASHIALRGLFPDHMLQDGQHAHNYLDTTPGAPQCLVGKHDGKLCRPNPNPNLNP